MVWEVKELRHWMCQWSAINDSIIRFSKISHALHPFALPSSSSKSGGDATIAGAPAERDKGEETRGAEAPVEPQLEEETGKISAEAAEALSISVLYARVYSMLSTYSKVEYWSNAVVLQHLLASSIHAWVEQLCACSGGRLRVCPDIATEELAPPCLSWTSAVMDNVWEEALQANCEPWRKSTRDVAVAARRTVAASSAPMPATSHNDENNGVPLAIENEVEKEDTAALHAVVSFAMHYHRMRWLLKVVFLRVDVEMNDIAWRILRSCVCATLAYNSATIQSVLCRAAERCVRSSIDGGANPLGPPGAVVSGALQDSDVCLVSRVLAMLDDCRAQDITRGVTESVERLVQQQGFTLACARLAPLSESRTTERVPTLHDASAALQDCMHTLRRLRSATLLYFGGTSHYIDEVSELGRERAALAARAFTVGFCHGSVLLNFVDAWALPLWQRACDEEHERLFCATIQAGLPRTPGTGSDNNNSNCDDDDGARSSVVFRSFDEALSQLGEIGGSGGGGDSLSNNYNSSSNYGVLPRPGLATLIFFLSPEAKLLAEFEAHFAAAVQRHLESLLAVAHNGEVALRSLPRDVYQRCVFFIKMTNHLLGPIVAAGCDSAYAALRAVRKGMQSFFVGREPCVILTLASALHTQVVGEPAAAAAASSNQGGDSNIGCSSGGSSHLEILDTILELVSLLHSKDLFVDCYCGLLAPRLMAMQRVGELDVDTEVISRLAVRLGESLAAEPLALLRDVRTSMADPRCTMVGTDEAQQFGIIRQVRVLCSARWKRYVTVTVTLSEMQHSFERERWFDTAMLQALHAFEDRYGGSRKSRHSSPSSGSGREVPSPSDRSGVFFAHSGRLGNYDDGGNNSGNGNDISIPNVNDGEVDAVRGLPHTSGDADSVAPPAAVVQAVQRRQLTWSLGSGALTVVCHAASPEECTATTSVQVLLPPVGLLLLQALQRHGERDCCSFDFLHGCLPVAVPKPLLGSVLSSLVRHRVVRRSPPPAAGAGMCATYSLPPSFATCRRRRVVVAAAPDATHHWVPHAQEAAGDRAVVSDIVDAERMKKLEAGIVRVMKSRRCLSHAELLATVAQNMVTRFVVTAPMLKRCVAQLIEREFIAREGRDTYVYLA
ncbi:hypothetical protein DQ04_03981060 [Trypanosoma grayi]|uniref:hypothetical protein n=1 Tax=Trypanosoma grayi TaxID=71804 RepID=UPI0004F49C63|nr:hypothetical protein DQ04_03981060 [Trypanosoma grayi]KEG10253.1 hypothetical protein DQ04_03981060 [Trypanosoma grayi]